MIFRVEVHSRDRQVEHYIVPNSERETDALQKMRQYFADKGHRLGLWDKESDQHNPHIHYFIFDIQPLPPEPVIFVAGEFRSQYPI